MPSIKVKNAGKLPAEIGVYILKDKAGEIIYIGKSFNIRQRVKTHLSNKTWMAVPGIPNPLAEHTAKIDYIITDSEPEALIKESELIKKHRPKYNIMLRDDKQYFYVGFVPQGKRTKIKSLGKLPYLKVTHQPSSLKIGNRKLKIPPASVAGPFTDGGSLKTVLRYLRKIFPYYTKPHGRLPCQYCHIDRCPGPDPDIQVYAKNISKIKQILGGKKPRVITSLKKEMKKYSDNLEFERAKEVKRQVMALENIFSHNFQIQMTKQGQTLLSNSKAGSDPALSLSSIEAYDISNIQGREPVASMVRFDNGKPNKKMYRKFKIRLPEKPDDFAMIREVIRRRLSHPEWPYPDLFLIDGGKGQLSSALAEITKFQILDSKFQIAALAKRENEFFVPGQKESIKLNDIDAQTRNLLMHARDEAHRFAISYHRKLHRKKSLL